MNLFISALKEDDILIDVRSAEEFNRFSTSNINIPVINKKLHNKLKKMYPLAIPIIAYGLYKDREKIKRNILQHKDGSKRIVFMCSRGRLRSPFMFFYAKAIGIKSKVLFRGVKGTCEYKNMGVR